MTLFRLNNSYEMFVDAGGTPRLVRIEIFVSLVEQNVFRARVWLQSSYNMYPTFMNLGKQGEDLKQVYSSDHINAEITSLIAEEPSWATGMSFDSEQDFVDRIRMRVAAVMEQ